MFFPQVQAISRQDFIAIAFTVWQRIKHELTNIDFYILD